MDKSIIGLCIFFLFVLSSGFNRLVGVFLNSTPDSKNLHLQYLEKVCSIVLSEVYVC